MKSLLVVITVALSELSLSLGAVHKVGDSSGWTTIGNVDYNKWASANKFHVGDIIAFEYNKQFHNVVRVTREDYESCNATSSISEYTTGSDSIVLKRPGHYYYLCGFPGHCEAGQKLHILVSDGGVSHHSPSPSPSPSPSQTIPHPPKSTAPPLITFSTLLSLLATIVASLLS